MTNTENRKLIGLMRIKAYLSRLIREFLGIDHLPSLEMYKAMELTARERHRDVMDKLSAIEKRLINEHIGQTMRPRFAEPLDWELVQAIAAQDLIDNPQREH